MGWLWWAVAVAAVIAEVISVQFVLLMVAVGAVAAGTAQALHLSALGQIVVFAVVSIAGLVLVRPPLVAAFQRGRRTVTGAAGLVGREALVVRTVTALDGRVKLAGDVWSARTADGAADLEPGARVTVVRIEGATAVVGPVEESS